MSLFRFVLASFGLLATPFVLKAAPAAASEAEFDAGQIAQFDRKATLARQLGATHVSLADGLPPATWQFQTPNDPYPAWFIQRPDFVKLFPPPQVRPYVDVGYARRVVRILEARCAILRRLGLKAHWGANIPQVLPEAFFTAYPQLRGPRVDHPNRSRAPWFSPCVDQPETLQIYGAAMKELLAHCPEIESFSFLTQDSGSGFCWAESLYPGANGPSWCRERPMAERVSSFLISLQAAARDSGHTVEINLNPVSARQWMLPTFLPEQFSALVRALPRGIAVQGREGPDGRAFAGIAQSDAYSRGAFYPVVGLLVPDLRWLRTGVGGEDWRPGGAKGADSGPARRLISLRTDEEVMQFEGRLYQATHAAGSAGSVERLAALRTFAAQEAGAAGAEDLLAIWLELDDADRRLDALNFGAMLQFGHVLNRWISRPMVPLPSELTEAEKRDYRPFLFQAKGEEQADNLIDIQAMRMYEGFGARLLFQRVTETVTPDVQNAIRRARQLAARAPAGGERHRWQLLAMRLEVLTCLLESADHMVAYQAQLDRAKALGFRPEPNPPLGAEQSWDRADLINLARAEIDTTVRLRQLLLSTPEPLLDLAPVAQEETIMRLGPGLTAQLKHKIDVMNAHWRDYDRVFTVPNP